MGEFPPDDDTDPRERQVNRVIFDYHQAVERGEPADPARWIARRPDLAAELTRYFEDLAGGPALRFQDSASDGLYPGAVLGDYVILERLGRGGQGVVWKASPRQAPEIVVALKTMIGPARNDLVAVERFRNDARAIARMNHPNIIRTTYVGEQNGRWFIVMDLMEGGTVADRLADFAEDPRAAALLAEKVARAIHHAHTRNEGVIHLDLKPGNILLSQDGEPKVTDFGLAVRAEAVTQALRASEQEPANGVADDVSITLARAGIVGTLPYLSTEMAAGRWHEVSTLSDVYGLGAVLYALLTGRPPFAGPSAAETLRQVVGGELRSPRTLNSHVDRELNAVCLKCLARVPALRYGSADALANDLRRWLERRPTLAGGRPSPLRELRFWAVRHPLSLALLVAIGVFLWVASTAVSLAQSRRANADEAARLARQLDRELKMIRVFTGKLAENSQLRSALRPLPDPDDASHRQQAVQAVLDAIDLRTWFDLAGGNPLVNILVLDPTGVELADTLSNRSTVGDSFAVRDYFHGLIDQELPRDHVHVARTFRSIKDQRYKIAVSTRIWSNEGQLLGVLVANFTIGPKLLGFDLRQEPVDAAVFCPRDLSDPATNQSEDASRSWRYVAVLDRDYGEDSPMSPADAVATELDAFQRDRQLQQVSVGPRHGHLVDYQRVGATELVVMSRRCAPWPLSWWR